VSDTTVPIRAPEAASGFCRRCRTIHSLPPDGARREARRLIKRFEEHKSIASQPEHFDLPGLSTGPLFGAPRGKMFGVLECLSNDGKPIWLYAFSGQYNGYWQVPGWAPPLFDVDRFHRINDPEEKLIKAMTRQIEQQPDASAAAELKSERTKRCRQLMKDIHDLYVLNNFRGESATFDEVVGSGCNKPTGLGDCCAPKLLSCAAMLRLKPVSLAEFYFGRPNRSHSRHHKHLYAPCTDKCGPLLGFLLCGI